MTLPAAPSGPDPEKVLAQALHAMAGGDKPTLTPGPGLSGAVGSTPATRRLSIPQILLIAVLVGLCIGIPAGLLSLLR